MTDLNRPVHRWLVAAYRQSENEKGESTVGSLHCLNVGCGNAAVIVTSTATFLVDCNEIDQHASLLPANRQLRGVFITHQHSDHYSGLAYLKEKGFSIEWLIYSPYDRRRGDNSVTLEEWNEFNALKDHFVGKGTQIRAPYRQDDFSKPYWAPDGLEFWLLGPHSSIANSDTREIHDASLVISASLGSRRCLFAGDASDANLEYVANQTNNYCNDILYASHHGSLNGAQLDFVKGCNAKYTLISTKSGVHENVPHPTALRRYNEHTKLEVYRTDVRGSIKWDF